MRDANLDAFLKNLLYRERTATTASPAAMLRSHFVQALLAVLPYTHGQSVAIRTSSTTVVYGGHEYCTMMPDVPAEGDRSSSSLCHESCHPLPEGYEIAPAYDDVINNVIAAFTWSTHGAHQL